MLVFDDKIPFELFLIIFFNGGNFSIIHLG